MKVIIAKGVRRVAEFYLEGDMPEVAKVTIVPAGTLGRDPVLYVSIPEDEEPNPMRQLFGGVS